MLLNSDNGEIKKENIKGVYVSTSDFLVYERYKVENDRKKIIDYELIWDPRRVYRRNINDR